MPARSEAQRRLMGAALSAKREGRDAGGEVGRVERSMNEEQLRDFARKPGRNGRSMRRSKRK